jgi:hypothetical protein
MRHRKGISRPPEDFCNSGMSRGRLFSRRAADTQSQRSQHGSACGVLSLRALKAKVAHPIGIEQSARNLTLRIACEPDSVASAVKEIG